jgi:WhiB family redox-sensing transcriptional regulator
MTHQGQNPHHALRYAIDKVGKTPCMECPEVFFPEDFPDKHTKQHAIRTARALCNLCPVKQECFTYANEVSEGYGIWAGTLPSER